MEKTFLPSRLLKPFFDQKDIFYRTGNNPEQRGWLGLTVFGDGSVWLHLYSVTKKGEALQSDGQILTSDMLEKIFWSEEHNAFVAIF
jgi:hypothetical protein